MLAAIKRFLVVTLVMALLMVGVLAGLWGYYTYFRKEPVPLADQCIAHVADQTVAVRPDQAHWLSIIVGVATQRDLVPRASTIAIATVYQETGIRNLDWGDRDSLGLFQQRPSQGWGTPEEVQDPYHASNRFYEALVKVPNWENGDVNDVAQAVQRSGHPEEYRKHVENARRLASALTGQTPASFSCRISSPPVGDPAGLAAFLDKTLPASSTVTHTGREVRVEASTSRLAWSAASIAVANHHEFGLGSVDVAGTTWTPSSRELADWVGEPNDGRTVIIRFSTASASPSPSP